MSTSLNFNLFGNFLHRKQTNQRRISDPHLIYDEAPFGNIFSGNNYFLRKQPQLRWCRNRRPVSVRYYFSFHQKIGSSEEDKDPEDSSISHTGDFFLFSVRGILFNAPVLRNGCSLIDPLYTSVFTNCYLNQYSYFANIRINCNGK